MCGIAGIVNPTQQDPPSKKRIESMIHTLRFRGPDDQGIYLDNGVGFGHTRLKVIDLEGGVQPMTDSSGRFTIILNGEIYNYRELRDELIKSGIRFSTASDTEVLLMGYITWGISVLDRIAGMFAFAVWDNAECTLLMARDRLGVKPLYWSSLTDGTIVFGSELTTVIASGMIGNSLNRNAINRYLSLGYVLGSEAVIKDVHRLPPAHFLFLKKGDPPLIKIYWNAAEIWKQQREVSQSFSKKSGSILIDEFSVLMDKAVSQRLISDVPLGAFLSGGLDSTTIVALMKKKQQQVNTFSIGFSQSGFDELPDARKAAKALGVDHQDELIDLNSTDLLLEIVERLDEPFADTSILPTYLLCRTAKKHLTVALSGDGADELLAGYPTHLADQLHNSLQLIPSFAWRAATGFFNCLPPSYGKIDLLYKLRQFASGHSLTSIDAHAWWRMIIVPQQLSRLTGIDENELSKLLFERFRILFNSAKGLNTLDRFLYVDYMTWLCDDILVKVDRASMNHGLEVRSPFLDHRLIEFCMKVPTDLKLNKINGKYLLREYSRNMIPKFVLKKKKSGFNAPVSVWLCTHWRDIADDAFSKESILKIGGLDPKEVTLMWKAHYLKKKDYGHFLFALLILILWHRRQVNEFKGVY